MSKFAIYQKGPRHTEIIGFLINCLQNISQNCHIDIYNNTDECKNWVEFYSLLFNIPDENRFDSELIYQNYSQYDLIISTTLTDTLHIPDCDKILYIAHVRSHIFLPFMKKRLTLSPLTATVCSVADWTLPVFEVNNSFEPIPKPQKFGIVGRPFQHFRNMADIIELIKAPHQEAFSIEFIGMSLHIDRTLEALGVSSSFNQDDVKPMILNMKKDLIDLNFNRNLPTVQYIQRLMQCKFLLTTVQEGEFYHKDRLTGTIPLAINFNIPLIIDQKTANIYSIDNTMAIIYDKSLLEVIEYALAIPDEEYFDLIRNMRKYKSQHVAKNITVLNKFI